MSPINFEDISFIDSLSILYWTHNLHIKGLRAESVSSISHSLSLSLSVSLLVCVSLWHVHCLWITNLTLAFIPLLFRYSLTSSPLPLYACGVCCIHFKLTSHRSGLTRAPVPNRFTCDLQVELKFILFSLLESKYYTFSCFSVSYVIRNRNILWRDVQLEFNLYCSIR